MLKAAIVFCLIGVEPCTRENATHVMERPGNYPNAPACNRALIREAQAESKKRGNTEYFRILCPVEQ